MNNKLIFLKEWGCIRRGEIIHWSGRTVQRLIDKKIAQKVQLQQVKLDARKIDQDELSQFIDWQAEKMKKELIEFIRIRQ